MFSRMPDRQQEQVVEAAIKRLPAAKAPDAIWNSIEVALDRPADLSSHPSIRLWYLWACAAATAFAIAAIALQWRSAHKVRWEVVRTIGTQEHTETISAGDWLQTDNSTHAQMRVGNIGTVEIEPGTRLRVVTTKPLEHRLSLQHGEISATIYASPKLFFVETKSATAVDLGCQYKMKVDDAGNGLLRVTLGWVSFEWQGRESLVPAGASCRTRPAAGPGTPFFDDSPDALKTALNEFDFKNGGETSLRTILASARSRDTLTLWHLLSRVAEPLRPSVYDRMASFAVPPAGVTREKALELDSQTLKIWKDELAWSW